MNDEVAPEPSHHRLTPLPAVRLVARRELIERARTRAFQGGTIFVVVLSAVMVLLPKIIPASGDPEWTVAVVGSSPAGLDDTLDALSQAENVTIELEPSDGSPDEIARQDAIDVVLVDGRELVSDGEPPVRLQSLLTGAVAQANLVGGLTELDAPPADVAALLEIQPLTVRTLDVGGDEQARQSVAFLGVVILFVALLTYGAWVMTSVLEEKSNRVVEIVVSAIRPTELLAGKVIGVGLLGLGQLTLVVAVGLGVSAVSGSLPELPPGTVPIALAGLAWFLLGFAFYAVGYAATASLASRQEDAQNAVTPIVTVLIAAYFLVLTVVNPDPGGTASRIISQIPLFSPLAMPTRIAVGEVEVWEVALSVVLMVVATWAMVVVAAKVYTNALLRTGSRLTLRGALRSGD